MNAARSGSAQTSEVEWTPGNAIRRATEILRSEGPRVLWFRFLGETVYRRMILFERPLGEPIIGSRAEIPVTISLLEPSDIDEYLRFRPGAVASDIRSRLEQGHLCWVAREQGTIVHAIWAATGNVWIQYLGCEMRLAPDEVYLYESYTSPAVRRLKVNAARAAVLTQYFRDRSLVRLLALVMPENPAGVNATIRSGYRRAGVIGCVKAGPWRHDFSRIDPGIRPVTLDWRSAPSRSRF